MALAMGFSHKGQTPNWTVFPPKTPLGWGRIILGGGMVGPACACPRARAGEVGEYHHSRNLTKKRERGSRILRDSRTREGLRLIKRRKVAIHERLVGGIAAGAGG